MPFRILCNKPSGGVYFRGRSFYPGDSVILDEEPERLPDGLICQQIGGVPDELKRDQAEGNASDQPDDTAGSEAPATVETMLPEWEHFPDELKRDQAEGIGDFYNISDRTIAAWLRDGEIEGARKASEAHNAPWIISKRALLERILKEIV